MSKAILRALNESVDVGGLGVRTGTHIQVGLPAALGQFVPLRTTMAILVARRLYPTPEAWMIVGMAEVSTGTVANAAGFSVDASMGYQFAVARLYPNCQVGPMAEPIRLDFDGAFAQITPALPKWPEHLHVVPASGGAFLLRWTYSPYGQGGFPTDFQMFQGTTAAGVDYGTPLTDSGTSLTHVVHVAGQLEYEITISETYTDGTPHYFAVRARNSAGVAELNEVVYGPVAAVATVPAAAGIRSISQRR